MNNENITNNFKFNEVTEEDILKGMVESNIPVFLHGKSGDGKSARVKQLDPDCQIIYMMNATLDSINGKSVYNSETEEMIDIPPTWYIKLKEKCEKEPDKIHILFFDELTNATKSVQGMALNIVLDKEVNGKWNLPENTRIVAAGNEKEESSIAGILTEPLFNRFAHVYIDTNINAWSKWAMTPSKTYEKLDYDKEEKHLKIHPSICSYLTYKNCIGQDCLRTEYTGKEPNADPRKWEMASKVLYKTKQPEMLRSLIGNSLTQEFIEFTKQPVLTVEDVINKNYTHRTFDMDISRKFATAVSLSEVTEENFELIKKFVKKLGKEPCALFESMWIQKNEERLEIISELQLAKKYI